MRGVDLVFSVQPSSGQPGSGVTDEQEVAAGLAVVEAAEGEGVRHLVYSSALAARVGRTGVAHFDTKAVIEDRVRRSSLAWTIVRPATFMEMVVEPDAIIAESEAGWRTFYVVLTRATQLLTTVGTTQTWLSRVS